MSVPLPTPEQIAQLSGVLCLLALGGTLGWFLLMPAGPRWRRDTRATLAAATFAVVVFIMAWTSAMNLFGDYFTSAAITFRNLAEYGDLAIPFALATFAYAFLRPYSRKFGVIAALASVVTASLWAFNAANPCQFRCYPDANSVHFGWMDVISFAVPLWYALVADFVAYDALKGVSDRARKASFLVALALLFYSFVQSGILLTSIFSNGPPKFFVLTTWTPMFFGEVLGALGVLPAIYALACLARTAHDHVDTMLHWAPRAVFASVAAYGSGLFLGAIVWIKSLFGQVPPEADPVYLGLLLKGIWTFMVPVVVGYAIVQFRLFDLTQSQKAVFRRGPAVVLAVVAILTLTSLVQRYARVNELTRYSAVLIALIVIGAFVFEPFVEFVRRLPVALQVSLLGALIAGGALEIVKNGTASVLLFCMGILVMWLFSRKAHSLGEALEDGDLLPPLSRRATMSDEEKAVWMEVRISDCMQRGGWNPQNHARYRAESLDFGVPEQTYNRLVNGCAEAFASRGAKTQPETWTEEPLGEA